MYWLLLNFNKQVLSYLSFANHDTSHISFESNKMQTSCWGFSCDMAALLKLQPKTYDDILPNFSFLYIWLMKFFFNIFSQNYDFYLHREFSEFQIISMELIKICIKQMNWNCLSNLNISGLKDVHNFWSQVSWANVVKIQMDENSVFGILFVNIVTKQCKVLYTASSSEWIVLSVD